MTCCRTIAKVFRVCATVLLCENVNGSTPVAQTLWLVLHARNETALVVALHQSDEMVASSNASRSGRNMMRSVYGQTPRRIAR
jgi:hypothetical protein